MQVTIKGTSPTDTLDEGEVRTVELTPYVRNLIRNGLAVQVPRELPKFNQGGLINDPAAAATAIVRDLGAPSPVKKTPAKKTAAKKTPEPDAKVLEAAADARDAAHALAAARTDAAGELSAAARTFIDETRTLGDEE